MKFPWQKASVDGDVAASNSKPRQRWGKKTVQAQIHYEAINEAGIAWLGGKRYSATLALSDIDYQLAPSEVQEGLIEKYAQFINGHLAGQHVQVTILNRVLDKARLLADVELAEQGDGFDSARREYNALIASRLETGRNNCVTEKLVTVTVEAEDYAEAQMVLSRILAEDASLLRQVGGCQARQLTGKERVDLLAHLLRPHARIDFDYASLIGQKTTTKDVVAPWSMSTADPDRIELTSDGHSTWWQVLVLRDMPTWMSDRVLKEIAEIPANLTVSLHFDPLDQAEGLAMVKRQIANMDIQRSNEQRKLVKQGLSEDLLPHELQAAHAEASELRNQLEQTNEKLFTTRIVIGVSGPSKEELTETVKRVRRVCAKHSCNLDTTRYMQVDGLNAVLPLGQCRLPMFRTLTTAVAAVMIPFTTQEILQPSGLFYGANALSKNLIVGDRTVGMNSNAFILGTIGSGKSQFAKFEIEQVFLTRLDDDIIIIDPEREYVALGEELGASRIIISAGSTHCINPLDLDKLVTTSEGDPVLDKCSFVLSLAEVLLGGSDGLSASARSILDRVTNRMYRAYWTSPRAAAPTLESLHENLLLEPELEARALAGGLELYAKGSSAGFAKQTNVSLDERVTIFDTADLGRDLQTFGMMVTLEAIWSKVARNRAAGKRTWIYIDEFHILFANDYAAEHCQTIFKRVRKWGAAATGITQNIEELLDNERARLMLSNSDGLFLLNQQATDADALTDLLKLSAQQRSFFTNTTPGCGLMKLGPAVVPFDNTMDPSSHLFEVFSTSFKPTPARPAHLAGGV